MQAQPPTDSPPYITVEEYLEGEQHSELRHEYFEGQRIPSLEEYVVVSQDKAEPEVRIFRRAEGWEPGETHHTGEFTLRSASLTLKVSDVYSN